MSGPRAPGTRRVVVYNGEDGKSRLSADEQAPRAVVYTSPRGMQSSVLWGVQGGAALLPGMHDTAPGVTTLAPKPGDNVFLMLTLAPDSAYGAEDFDGAVAAAEALLHAPGIADAMEPDNPGFHRTDTVDYITVLTGEVWIETDTGETQLSQGDTLIQLGTRHAWRNRTNVPVTLVVVLNGVARG